MLRDRNLSRLQERNKPYDIIIIGGGATGLGAAVDAASRGHDVLLIEQSDFAKGTSSRSTKLVHGGVRYLRQGNISLVLEALKERGLLVQNAPHLVHNMSFVIPNYKWWEGPFYGIGMKVYDQMAGRLGLSPSRSLSREETIDLIPTVEQEHLVGGVVYHDGQFDDARLAVNLAQTADDLGADVLNYTTCIGLIKSNGVVTGVRIRDEESGQEQEVRGHAVINAAGVFADGLRKMDDPSSRNIIAVSQGIHIVLPKEFLPGNASIMIPKTADGRVLFAVPWHGRVVVGTTDSPLHAPSLEPRALKVERRFIMEHAARYLTKDPEPEDVLSVFAGLRPLVKNGDDADTAALSRDHTILVSESGLITITGGKWTTYRKMAQDVIDHAEIVSGVESKPCPTEHLQIHGWTREAIQPARLGLYGADADEVQAIASAQPELAGPVHDRLELTGAEVAWHARAEMARTAEDVLARRSRMLLLDAKASIEAAPRVAAILARELKRDRAWEEEQVRTYTGLARGYVFTDPASTAAAPDHAGP